MKQKVKQLTILSLVFAWSAMAAPAMNAKLWEEDQIAQCHHECNVTISLSLPDAGVAKAILSEMDGVIEHLLSEDLVNRVLMAEPLARFQQKVEKELLVVQKYGDFTKKSLEAGQRLADAMEKKADEGDAYTLEEIFGLIADVKSTRSYGLKLSRLQYEIEQRVR